MQTTRTNNKNNIGTNHAFAFIIFSNLCLDLIFIISQVFLSLGQFPPACVHCQHSALTLTPSSTFVLNWNASSESGLITQWPPSLRRLLLNGSGEKIDAAKYQNLSESSFSKVKPLATAVHGLKWHLCDGNESNTTRFYDFMACVLQVQLLMMVTLGVLSGDLSLPATKIWSPPGSFFSPAAFEVFLLQTKFTFYLSFKSDIHIFNWCLLPKRIRLQQ